MHATWCLHMRGWLAPAVPRAVDGEKDPRCLLLCFEAVRCLLALYHRQPDTSLCHERLEVRGSHVGGQSCAGSRHVWSYSAIGHQAATHMPCRALLWGTPSTNTELYIASTCVNACYMHPGIHAFHPVCRRAPRSSLRFWPATSPSHSPPRPMTPTGGLLLPALPRWAVLGGATESQAPPARQPAGRRRAVPAAGTLPASVPSCCPLPAWPACHHPCLPFSCRRISREDLAAGLEAALVAEPLFAPYLVPLACEKLSSTLRCGKPRREARQAGTRHGEASHGQYPPCSWRGCGLP